MNKQKVADDPASAGLGQSNVEIHAGRHGDPVRVISVRANEPASSDSQRDAVWTPAPLINCVTCNKSLRTPVHKLAFAGLTAPVTPQSSIAASRAPTRASDRIIPPNVDFEDMAILP